jgi:hypothetical protein
MKNVAMARLCRRGRAMRPSKNAASPVKLSTKWNIVSNYSAAIDGFRIVPTSAIDSFPSLPRRLRYRLGMYRPEWTIDFLLETISQLTHCADYLRTAEQWSLEPKAWMHLDRKSSHVALRLKELKAALLAALQKERQQRRPSSIIEPPAHINKTNPRDPCTGYRRRNGRRKPPSSQKYLCGACDWTGESNVIPFCCPNCGEDKALSEWPLNLLEVPRDALVLANDDSWPSEDQFQYILERIGI